MLENGWVNDVNVSKSRCKLTQDLLSVCCFDWIDPSYHITSLCIHFVVFDVFFFFLFQYHGNQYFWCSPVLSDFQSKYQQTKKTARHSWISSKSCIIGCLFLRRGANNLFYIYKFHCICTMSWRWNAMHWETAWLVLLSCGFCLDLSLWIARSICFRNAHSAFKCVFMICARFSFIFLALLCSTEFASNRSERRRQNKTKQKKKNHTICLNRFSSSCSCICQLIHHQHNKNKTKCPSDGNVVGLSLRCLYHPIRCIGKHQSMLKCQSIEIASEISWAFCFLSSYLFIFSFRFLFCSLYVLLFLILWTFKQTCMFDVAVVKNEKNDSIPSK